MILNSKWLAQYVNLPKNMDDVLKKLSLVGLEVESVQKRQCDSTFLRVAEILESKKHPNADRLSVCRVKTQDQEYTIVCGAKNYKVGDKVILALPGAELKGGLKIKESKIRGEHSQGMLCSETELGFCEESNGILILSPQVKLTDNIQKVLGLGTVIFELNVTPNRPDCMSFIGVARECSALLGKTVQYPKVKLHESKVKIQDKIKVKLQSSKSCPRYMGRLIENVKIGPSPEWLKTYLESIGQRSINNVVDVTNFVLMEWGQPLHAFDFDKIANSTLVIRNAHENEELITLDGATQKLTSQDLVIADSQKALALAGIMGGTSSEITDATQNIFIESAYFDPTTIRKTSKRLGLSSESSKRFERGVDIEGVQKALDRAADLIVQVAGGEVCKGAIDAYPKKFPKKTVTLQTDKLNQYLGYKLSSGEIKKTLASLGFKAKSSSSSKSTFEVPSFRVDVSQDVDLIEEVARLQGYDKIPTVELSGQSFLEQKIEKKHLLSPRLKEVLISAGLNEVVHISFCSPSDLEKIGWSEKTLKLQNPIGEEYSFMRPSLVPSLLKNLVLNLHHQTHRVRTFELRNVYDEKGAQTLYLCGLLSGNQYSTRWDGSKDQKEQKVDFYDMKALVELLLKEFPFKNIEFRKEKAPTFLHPGWFSNIYVEKTLIGCFGKIHPQVEENFDLEQSAFLFEINVDEMQKIYDGLAGIRFVSLPKFPAVKRDLSLLISESISHEAIYDVIYKEGGGILKNVELFDVYRGEQIPADHKSLAFSLTYQSLDKTLIDTEVNQVHEGICKALSTHCKAQIR